MRSIRHGAVALLTLLLLGGSLSAQAPYRDKVGTNYRICVTGDDGQKYCGAKLSKQKPPPVPPPVVNGVPNAYLAITDRTPRPKPAVPVLGPAGFTFPDPTFGSKILRVTDANTRPGLINRSFRVASSAHSTVWNATNTMFYVTSTDGAAIPFTFDAAAMKATRVQPDTTENGGLTIPSQVEPQFSRVDPDIIYVNSGPANHTINAFKISTHLLTPVVNLDTLGFDLTNTYVGGIQVGGSSPEVVVSHFGGGIIDAHYEVVWQPVDGSARKLLNTLTLPIPFHLHAIQIDRSARYVFLYPSGADRVADVRLAQVYLWDTSTNSITAITNHPAGHDSAGFGVWFNQDCCTASPWDAGQWQFRSLAAPDTTKDVISPLLTPQEIYLADHSSWSNAQPDRLVPIISSLYRFYDYTAPWRAWDDEIVAIHPTTGLVYRLAHHRSNVGSDTNPAQPYFWYEPIANISPNGLWVLFTSNWEKTLGTDSIEGVARQDVFIVQLTPAP